MNGIETDLAAVGDDAEFALDVVSRSSRPGQKLSFQRQDFFAQQVMLLLEIGIAGAEAMKLDKPVADRFQFLAERGMAPRDATCGDFWFPRARRRVRQNGKLIRHPR